MGPPQNNSPMFPVILGLLQTLLYHVARVARHLVMVFYFTRVSLSFDVGLLIGWSTARWWPAVVVRSSISMYDNIPYCLTRGLLYWTLYALFKTSFVIFYSLSELVFFISYFCVFKTQYLTNSSPFRIFAKSSSQHLW